MREVVIMTNLYSCLHKAKRLCTLAQDLGMSIKPDNTLQKVLCTNDREPSLETQGEIKLVRIRKAGQLRGRLLLPVPQALATIKRLSKGKAKHVGGNGRPKKIVPIDHSLETSSKYA